MCDNTTMISIVVPIYKVEKYLDRCVQSLIHQTHSNVEIILVDDGSPDNCPVLCDQYAEQDNRIKVIHKTNGGLSDSRNRGLRIAQGEYILYVDSDDYIELDACERLLSARVNGADVTVGVIKEIRDSGLRYQRHSNLEEGRIYTAKEYVLKSIEMNEWYAPAVLNLYRRNFLIKHGLYFKVDYYFEDIEMLPRLFLANPKVCYVNYPFYNYAVRDNSIMTSEVSDEKKQMTIDIYTNWMALITEVEDHELKKALSGILVRYYIANARMRGITGWNVKGMDFMFAFKHALNSRERLKVVMYSFMPELYCKLGVALKKN